MRTKGVKNELRIDNVERSKANEGIGKGLYDGG